MLGKDREFIVLNINSPFKEIKLNLSCAGRAIETMFLIFVCLLHCYSIIEL